MGTARDEQRRDTEAKVLSVAGDLFRERGFARTTIRDIAAACGVSAGTVASVGEKDALLVASFDRLIARIHQGRSGSGGVSAGGPVEQILALFDPFVEIFTADAALARAYGAVLVAGEHDSILFSELAKTLIDEIAAALLRTGRRSDARHAHSLAESIYFAYVGRLFSWSPGAEADAEDLRRALRRIISAACGIEGSVA